MKQEGSPLLFNIIIFRLKLAKIPLAIAEINCFNQETPLLVKVYNVEL